MTVFTVVTLGLNPFLALWIGLMVTGLSMLLTPRGPLEEFRGLASVIEASIENIARVCEFTGVRGGAVYVARGDGVYVYVHPDGVPVSVVSGLNGSRLVYNAGGSPILVFKSPLGLLVSGEGDPCDVIGDLAVRKLGVADSILCSRRAEGLAVEFRGLKSGVTAGVRGAPGSIYGALVASTLAASTRSPVRLVREDYTRTGLLVYAEVVGVEELRG